MKQSGYAADRRRAFLLLFLLLLVFLRNGGSSHASWAVARQGLTMIFMTLGLSLEMIGGVLNLSFAAEIAASSCIGALLLNEGIALPLVFSLLLLFHLLFGLLRGLLIARLPVDPLLITLSMQVVVFNLTAWLTGGFTMTFATRSFYNELLFWAAAGLLALSLSLGLSFLLSRTYYGKYFRMLGESRRIMRESGLSETPIFCCLSAVSSFFYWIAAVILLSITSAGSARLGSGYLYSVIAAALLGGIGFMNGRGSVRGVWLGTFSLVLLLQLLSGVSLRSGIELILEGMLILLSIYSFTQKRS